MPIFEYKCPEGHTFDKLVSSSQASNTTHMPCPECSKLADRMISASNVHFKGNWFKTKGSY